MTISGDIPTLPGLRRRAGRRLHRTATATAVLTMAAAVVAASGAGAEIIKKDDMIRGITTTRDRCAATAQTLWLNVDKQDFCVRYYLSPPGGFSAGRLFRQCRPKNLAKPEPTVDTDLQGQERKRHLRSNGHER